MRIRIMKTYIRPFLLVFVFQDIPEDVDGGIRLNGNARLHALVVDIADEFLRACQTAGLLVFWGHCSDGGDGGLVVEAVKIASGGLELLDPFMGLWRSVSVFLSGDCSGWCRLVVRDVRPPPLSSCGSQKYPSQGPGLGGPHGTGSW